jgi:serine/threonine protein kinase
MAMREIFRHTAEKDKDASANAFIDRIIAERPDLADAAFYAPAQGKNSLTVMTADEVFKAPKTPEDAPFFAKEYKLLQHLNGFDLGVNIPEATHYSEESGFYAMSRLRGEPLTRDLLESLPVREQEKIADDLARFNAQFSKTVTDGDRQYLGLGTAETYQPLPPEEILDSLRKPHMQQALGPHYDAACAAAAQYARGFNADAEKKHVMMIHSDLHPGNIMYDREHQRLGVIDTGTGRMIAADMGLSPLNHSYPAAWMDRHLETFAKETGVEMTRAQIAHKKCLYGIRYLAQHPEDAKAADFLKGELTVWQAAQKPAASQPEIKARANDGYKL